MYQVIFHIDYEAYIKIALDNVNNLVNEFLKLEEKYHIIVLINGPAVKSLLKVEMIKEINKHDNNLVIFKACNNALKANKINRSDLNDKIEVVPSGVYELMLRQSQGYSYIKP